MGKSRVRFGNTRPWSLPAENPEKIEKLKDEGIKGVKYCLGLKKEVQE